LYIIFLYEENTNTTIEVYSCTKKKKIKYGKENVLVFEQQNEVGLDECMTILSSSSLSSM